MTCLALALFPCREVHAQKRPRADSATTKSGEGGKAKPAWGEAVDGVRVGLSAEKRKFDAGDSDPVKLVVHLRNDGKKEVTLFSAGLPHGWTWEFILVGGGKPFIPRWDDDANGVRATRPHVTLAPGTTKSIKAVFRQRSFMKGKGPYGFCSLVPGKYRITAWYQSPRGLGGLVQAANGDRRGERTTGAVEIDIAGRGDAWDTVGTAGPAALIDLLADKDKHLRATATVFLTEKGKGAVPALIEGLKDSHAGVRAGCAVALSRLREDARPAVAALAKALTDSDPNVRGAAAVALGRIGKGAKAAVPALVQAVKESKAGALWNVRVAAAIALGRIGDARGDVVAALGALLKDKVLQTDAGGFASVAEALGGLGREAKGVVPILGELLEDKSNRQRFYVLREIGILGPRAGAAVGAMARLVEDEKEDINLRIEAAGKLSHIGAAAKDAIPALERVRDKYRSAPKDQARARELANVAGVMAERIRKAAAKAKLPAKST